MFTVGSTLAHSESYRALEVSAKAAIVWTQQKQNLPLEKSRLVMRDLAARHSDLAYILKTKLTRNTLRFFGHSSDSSQLSGIANVSLLRENRVAPPQQVN